MLKPITINNEKIICLVDSGAEISVVSEKSAQKFKGQLKKYESSVSGLGNTKVTPLGIFEAEIAVDNLKCNHNFVVVPDNVSKYEVILGFDYIGKCNYNYNENGYTFMSFLADNYEHSIMNISIDNKKVEMPIKYEKRIKEIIEEYRPNKNAISPISIKIVLINEKSIRHVPRRLPLPEQKAVSDQVEDWLKNGIIRLSYIGILQPGGCCK